MTLLWQLEEAELLLALSGLLLLMLYHLGLQMADLHVCKYNTHKKPSCIIICTFVTQPNITVKIVGIIIIVANFNNLVWVTRMQSNAVRTYLLSIDNTKANTNVAWSADYFWLCSLITNASHCIGFVGTQTKPGP